MKPAVFLYSLHETDISVQIIAQKIYGSQPSTFLYASSNRIPSIERILSQSSSIAYLSIT